MHGLLWLPPLDEGSTLNPDPADARERYFLMGPRWMTHKADTPVDKHITTT